MKRRRISIVAGSLLPCLVLYIVLCFAAGTARAEIKTQWFDYKDGDTALQGYLAYDDTISGKRPGVLLLRRDGMSELTLEKTKMYAQQGYVVRAGYFR
jgi:hypothetical protein